MTNDSLLKIIGMVLDNRKLINLVLDQLDEEQLKHGILAIPESLVNETLKPEITSLSPMIRSYHLSFMEDGFLLDGGVNIPKIGGGATVRYMLKMGELQFGPMGHRVTLTYMEDVKGDSTVVNMGISAFKMKGTLLQKLPGLLKKTDAIYATGNMISVDLDRLGVLEKLPDDLNLAFVSARDGVLKLKFWIG